MVGRLVPETAAIYGRPVGHLVPIKGSIRGHLVPIKDDFVVVLLYKVIQND